MRAVAPLVPVFNHRLGLGYVMAVLRRAGHEVVPLDFEHILRLADADLSSDLQDRTEVYATRWSRYVQYFHCPELLFAARFPDDRVHAALSDDDRALVERLRPHVQSWVDAVLAFEPDAVLLPALVSNLWLVLWLSSAIGAAAPRVVRVLGGRGVTYGQVGELALRAGWADGVLAGEGESSIAPLLSALARPAAQRPPVAGAAWMDGDRLVSHAPAAGERLESLPLPDLSGLPFPGATLKLYADGGREFHDAISLGTSRWCPFRCAYCYESVASTTYRRRTCDAVLDEMNVQHERLGTPRLFFCDSTLNVSPEWLRQLAVGMRQLAWKPQVVFAHCEPTRLDADLLHALRGSGFEKLNFGVEALDPRTLRRMDRRPTIDEMTAVFTAAVEAGVSLGLNLIANYPGTSEDEFGETLAGTARLADRLRRAAAPGTGVRFMVSQARIDPHSSLFARSGQLGVTMTPAPLAVPASLQHLTPLIASMSLKWTDGTAEPVLAERFDLLRTYAESLSWVPDRASRRPEQDRRTAIDWTAVPRQLASVVQRVAVGGAA